MIRLIAMDLDNTLLRTDKSISRYTLDVLRRCRERRIAIAIATARSTQASARVARHVELDARIVYGGALALHGDEVVARFDLPTDTCRRLIDRLMRDPEVGAVYAINESIALTNDVEMSKTTDFTHYRLTDFSERSEQRFLKVSARIRTAEAFRRISGEFPDLDALRYTGEDLCRFSSRDATKWPALRAVCEHMGISAGQVAAFGDDLIDLEMLRECGVGVAVGNAVDEVKAVAKGVCGSNDEDGVARWIEAHLLR